MTPEQMALRDTIVSLLSGLAGAELFTALGDVLVAYCRALARHRPDMSPGEVLENAERLSEAIGARLAEIEVAGGGVGGHA